MTAVAGKNPVPAGTAFNKAIDDALGKQGLQIKKGDVVLFHTGWQDLATKDPKAFMAGEPGLGKEGAGYLVSKSLPSAPTHGAAKPFPSNRVSASSKCTEFCCHGAAPTY